MIKICDIASCWSCPFRGECTQSFEVYREKSEWIEELQEKLSDIQYLLDKLNKM